VRNDSNCRKFTSVITLSYTDMGEFDATVSIIDDNRQYRIPQHRKDL
jgi:hypothetical protein